MRVRADDASGRARRARLSVLALVIALVSLVVAAGCGDDEEDEDTVVEDVVETETGPNVTVLDILQDPEAHDDQLATVTGPVEDVIVDPGAFTIGEFGAADPAEQQIVVFPTADATLPNTVAIGDRLTVSGTVDVIARDLLGGEEFLFEESREGNELIEDFIDQPAIIADSVTQAPNGGAATTGTQTTPTTGPQTGQ